MASRALVRLEKAPSVNREDIPSGLSLLNEVTQNCVLFPPRYVEVSDSDDFFDVAQQLQQGEIRERLKAIVESNRGVRSRRSPGRGRGHKETVASLRNASLKRDSRFPSLSALSEGSSEAPIPESSQQLYHSIAGHDLQDEVSSSGAPASGEDNLSAFREESFDQERSSVPDHLLDSRTLTTTSEIYATKDELASVLACLRRLERKVDWLMSHERKVRCFEPTNQVVSCKFGGCFYKTFWLPLRSAMRSFWPYRLFLPALDMVESFAHFICN